MNKKLLVIVLVMSLLLVSSVQGAERSDGEWPSGWADSYTLGVEYISGAKAVEQLVEWIIDDAPATTSGAERVEESAEEKIPLSQNECNKVCQSSTKCKGIDEAWRKISVVLNIHMTEIWCPGSQWYNYDDVYVSKPAVIDTSGKAAVGAYSDHVNAAASKLGVPPSLIMGLIYYESKGEAEAISSTGCKGLMQVCSWETNYEDFKKMNPTIDIENNAFNPKANIYVGSYMLSRKLKAVEDCKEGDDRTKCAIAAYNAGEGLISMAAKAVKQGGPPASWDNVIKKLQDEEFVKKHERYSDKRTWKDGEGNSQSWKDVVNCKSLKGATRRRCKMYNLQFYVDKVFRSIETQG